MAFDIKEQLAKLQAADAAREAPVVPTLPMRYEDFQIITDGAGNRSIQYVDGSLIVVPTEQTPQPRVFTRVGKTFSLGFGEPVRHQRWLVGELNGVRVYVNGEHIILTTQDLYP